MPSAIIHRAVAKRVLEKEKIFTEEQDSYLYEVGAIAPDSWRNTKRFKESTLPKIEKRLPSHFSNPGSYLEHYDVFLEKYREYLIHPFMLGYLVHLLTDYLAHESIPYQKMFKSKNEDRESIKRKVKVINGILRQKLMLEDLRLLSEEETETLPKIDELEYDGINTTIAYINNELASSVKEESREEEIEEMLEEIEAWSNRILSELKKARAVKVKKL